MFKEKRTTSVSKEKTEVPNCTIKCTKYCILHLLFQRAPDNGKIMDGTTNCTTSNYW